MHPPDRTRSSSKRSRSPVVPAPASTSVPQDDGSSSGKPQKAQRVEEEDPPAKAGPPKMPAFLQISEDETNDKYAELARLEHERVTGRDRPDDDGQWARPAFDPVLDRYSNIYPWANNRVKLQVPEGVDDYINASPVTLVSTRNKQGDLEAGTQDKYICMQGPKKQTVDHVWHMIWHEVAAPHNTSPAVIIMLSPTHASMPDEPTRLFEKCFQYYPMTEDSPDLIINEKNDLGEDFKATVKFVRREPDMENTAIEVRLLEMTVDGQEDGAKPIYHYLYPDWPDFGALEEENVASILALMEISRKSNSEGENPRIIHCSAGVGRTGTFVALEFLVKELQGGAWEGWDDSEHAGNDPIFETVDQLRRQRKAMVQAYEQYAFLYEVCRKIWKEKYGVDSVSGEHKHDAPNQLKANICGTETASDD